MREDNQDVFTVCEALGLVALADGMGGARAGGVAAELAVEAALEHLVRARRQAVLGAAELQTALRLANDRVMGMSSAISNYRGMGTTLVAAAVAEPKCCVAHVGDSRAYRFRDGELEQLTRDHSLVQEWVDAGVISASEARHAPNRNIITRAIGAERMLRPDVVETRVAPGDLLLLCSDGLTGMLEDGEIAAALAPLGSEAAAGQGQALADAADGLVAAANQAGGTDNVTVVIVRCEPAPGDA